MDRQPRSIPVFGSNAELRALAEVQACDTKDKFVRDAPPGTR
jgi:catalase (peroxidase I)